MYNKKPTCSEDNLQIIRMLSLWLSLKKYRELKKKKKALVIFFFYLPSKNNPRIKR